MSRRGRSDGRCGRRGGSGRRWGRGSGGRRGAAAGAAGAGAGGAAGAGVAAAAPAASMCVRMSFLVTRPPVPVPVTVCGSTPCSAAMRATTGETNVRPFPDAAPGASSAGGGGASGASAGGSTTAPGMGAGAVGSCAGATGSGADGASAPRREDRCEERSDLDRLPLGHEQLSDDPVAGARDLGIDLVGRDLEQRLVTGDGLTRLLEPLRDRSFRHGDTHLGHHDLDLRSGGQS